MSANKVHRIAARMDPKRLEPCTYTTTHGTGTGRARLCRHSFKGSICLGRGAGVAALWQRCRRRLNLHNLTNPSFFFRKFHVAHQQNSVTQP